MGLVALEAVAAGLPLVLRDTGVFRELFGSDGALFPSDADSFAAALKSLRHDPAARTSAAANAAEHAGAYGAEVVAERAVELSTNPGRGSERQVIVE